MTSTIAPEDAAAAIAAAEAAASVDGEEAVVVAGGEEEEVEVEAASVAGSIGTHDTAAVHAAARAPRRQPAKGKKKQKLTGTKGRTKRPCGVLLPSAAAATAQAVDPHDATAKRARKTTPAVQNPTVAHADDVDVVDGASALSGELSPAVLSILADLDWCQRFLHIVLTHLTQSRTIVPNWHVVSSSWRHRLSEGGWTRTQKFLVRTPIGRPAHLVRSRRLPSDFTPAACERLYQLLCSRDRGPAAGKELAARLAEHEAYEADIRSQKLAFMSGGRVHPLPVPPESVRIEFTGGMLRGAPTSPSSRDDLAEDAEEPLDFWPGLSQTDVPAYRLDGATIRRWARGHEVHVHPHDAPLPPAVTQAETNMKTEEGAASAVPSTTAPPSVPVSSRLHLMSALSDLAHLSRRTLSDRAELVHRKQHLRTGLMIDLNSSEWSTPAANVPLHHATRPQAVWTANDDSNLLDAILAWLECEPEPTHATFASATGGSGSAALLPRTLAHWTSVRAMVCGWVYPLSFFRRRWWLLCQEATEAPPLVQMVARGQPLPAGAPPQPHNEALELVIRKVDAITSEVSRRMLAYRASAATTTFPAVAAVATTAEETAPVETAAISPSDTQVNGSAEADREPDSHATAAVPPTTEMQAAQLESSSSPAIESTPTAVPVPVQLPTPTPAAAAPLAPQSAAAPLPSLQADTAHDHTHTPTTPSAHIAQPTAAAHVPTLTPSSVEPSPAAAVHAPAPPLPEDAPMPLANTAAGDAHALHTDVA